MFDNNQFNNSIKNNQDFNKEAEDIDLSYLINFLFRNKKLISIVSLLFFFVFVFSTFFIRKIWTGQFEIVLENQNTSLAKIGPFSPNFNIGNKNMQTEIGILESPSVLMPIYEFVNKTKKQKDKNYKEITFLDWKNNQLKINLKNKTSILKISYFDDDKEIIIPALEKISLKYQDYSKRSTERSNQLSEIFLQNQVKKFKEKSALSYKAAQSFAIDQDLELFDLNTKGSNDSFIDNQTIIPNISIEEVRVNSANRIRDIDSQIKKFEELGNDSEQFQYIGSTIPALLDEGLVESLQKLEEEIDDASSKYRNKDLLIKNLVDKRYRLINLIRKRAIGYLKAEKLTKQALMESAMRPKDVLLNYKALIREAKRDEMTLIDLENKLRISEIENARLKDPWELITIPTLMESAVYPSKKQFGFYGLIIGIIFGIFIAYLKERKISSNHKQAIFEFKKYYNKYCKKENTFIFPWAPVLYEIIGTKNSTIFDMPNHDWITLKESNEIISNLKKNQPCYLILEKAALYNKKRFFFPAKGQKEIAKFFRDEFLEDYKYISEVSTFKRNWMIFYKKI